MSSSISKDDISIQQIHNEREAKVLLIFLSQVDSLQNSDVFNFDNHLDEVVKVNIFGDFLGKCWSKYQTLAISYM